MRYVLIAGGGTGGHVFPGLAVARELERLADVEILFVGSPRGLEARVVPEHGYALELLDVEPMKGGGAPRAIRGALVAAKAMQSARTLVRRLRPAAVLSVGGYAAGPAALACVSQRVPLAILEPFNPKHARPGLTMLMVSTTGEQHAFYRLDEALRPVQEELPEALRVSVERIEGASIYVRRLGTGEPDWRHKPDAETQ